MLPHRPATRRRAGRRRTRTARGAASLRRPASRPPRRRRGAPTAAGTPLRAPRHKSAVADRDPLLLRPPLRFFLFSCHGSAEVVECLLRLEAADELGDLGSERKDARRRRPQIRLLLVGP